MSHVLIVDDDDLIRRGLGRVLRRSHTISEASNIEDAKRILEADSSVDAIVSDLMMPNGTGLDLYLWVKVNRAALADRFMICSGGGPQQVLDGVTENSIPFYVKPIDTQDLLNAVQRLVTQGASRSSTAPT